MDGERTTQKIEIFVSLSSYIIQMLRPRKIVRKSDTQVTMIRGAINLFAINGVCVFLMDMRMSVKVHDFAFEKIEGKFPSGAP